MSLRTEVFLSGTDYGSMATGVSEFWFFEAFQRVYPQGLTWPAGLKKD